MKIRTEAHGAFPSADEFDQQIPRIAFFNSERDGSGVVGQRVSDKLLVLGVDDLDVLAIPAWLRGLLVLPDSLSYRVKRYALKDALGRGCQPSAPMSVGDARQVLEFVSELRRQGAQELIISCEYGKSRSVTLARFIGEVLLKGPASQDKVPNAWVDYLMRLAHSKSKAVF